MVVKFKPQKGALLNVRCRLWAQNVKYNEENGIGFVDFRLIVCDINKKILRSPSNNERKALVAERPEQILRRMFIIWFKRTDEIYFELTDRK